MVFFSIRLAILFPPFALNSIGQCSNVLDIAFRLKKSGFRKWIALSWNNIFVALYASRNFVLKVSKC